MWEWWGPKGSQCWTWGGEGRRWSRSPRAVRLKPSYAFTLVSLVFYTDVADKFSKDLMWSQ